MRLKEAGFRLQQNKCPLMTQSVEYLGHRLDAQGLHPTDIKVRFIQQSPISTNETELTAYLRFLTYYATFLRGLTTVVGPLHQLLHKDCKWRWTNEEEETFRQSKKLLLSAQLLVHYDPKGVLVLS